MLQRLLETQPPLVSYDAQSVAREILNSAEHPRREVTVGGVSRIGRAAYAAGGGFAEAALGFVAHRVFGKLDESGHDPATLASASGEGLTGGGRPGRPSVLAAAHTLRGRVARSPVRDA